MGREHKDPQGTRDGQAVALGFEGLHVFDISNLANPQLVASVDLPWPHTATGVPDLANNRPLITTATPTPCPWIDIVGVPLDDPADAAFIRNEPSDHTCHDIGVILGNGDEGRLRRRRGLRVFSLGGEDGGSLEDPELLYHIVEPDAPIGHSAAWSWDGEVLILGHEPGGGVDDQCKATDPVINRSFFFYDGDLGPSSMWTPPRPQSAAENCIAAQPERRAARSGRDVLVHGSYQSGRASSTSPTWQPRWSSAARSASDSRDLPHARSASLRLRAGRCLVVLLVQHHDAHQRGPEHLPLQRSATAGAMRLGHLNPQTQEFTID